MYIYIYICIYIYIYILRNVLLELLVYRDFHNINTVTQHKLLNNEQTNRIHSKDMNIYIYIHTYLHLAKHCLEGCLQGLTQHN